MHLNSAGQLASSSVVIADEQVPVLNPAEVRNLVITCAGDELSPAPDHLVGVLRHCYVFRAAEQRRIPPEARGLAAVVYAGSGSSTTTSGAPPAAGETPQRHSL